jgi:glutamate 5-kinase
MVTKIEAARIATGAGVNMLLTTLADLPEALAGNDIGTIFRARTDRKPSRLLWLAHAATPHGKLVLDLGATTAIKERGTSLLAAGVTSVEGDFLAGDTVELISPSGDVIARGLIAFDSVEIPAMLGKTTKQLAEELGPEYERELVHRDDLVLL